MCACRNAKAGIGRRTGTWVGATAGWFACLLLALLLLAGPAGAVDLELGFVGNLTGVHAYRAQDALDGFRLGVKHLGGRLGGAEIALTVMDDRRKTEGVKQAADRLINGEHAQVILVSSEPDQVGTLQPLAAASKVFLINLNAPPPTLSGRGCSPYFFSLAGLAETMFDLSGQYLQLQGYRNLAVVMPETPAARAALAWFRRGFKGNVAEVVSRRGSLNFEHSLTRIRQARPDAVFLLESGGMAVNFIRQFAEHGLKGHLPLFAPASTLDRTTLAAAGPAAVDAFSVGPWTDDLDTPSNRRLTADFEGEYGRTASAYAAQGYDAAMLLDAAVKSLDKKLTNPDTMIAALRRVEFAGTRPGFRFDSNQFPIQSYFVRQVVQDPRDRILTEQRGQLVRDARDGHAGECPMRWNPEPLPAPKG